MRFVFSCAILVFLCLNDAPSCGTPLSTDFAFGIPVEVEGDGALYELPLPMEVYRSVTRSDLADICMFNAKGEVVPHSLRQNKAFPASPGVSVDLPVFPVYEDSTRSLDGKSLHIQTDATGALIDMNVGGEATARQRVVAYILDASSIKKPLKALEMNWETEMESFISSISIESSDDLNHWRTILPSATIASLSFGDYHLAQKKVEFKDAQSRYLRMSWGENLKKVKLLGIKAELVGETAEFPRQWISAGVSMRKDRPEEYYFEAPGPLPVDRLRVKLPEKNTLVAASFLTRPSEAAEWIPRRSVVIYDLLIGGEHLVSTDIVFGPTSDRFWLMKTEKRGGGLGQGIPQVELGWIAQRLVFVARGDGPYTLAYGSGRLGPDSMRTDDLLAGFTSQDGRRVSMGTAQVGSPFRLGGETALIPPSGPLPWKKWALWAVLMIGAGSLGWMAVYLYRQMGKP